MQLQLSRKEKQMKLKIGKPCVDSSELQETNLQMGKRYKVLLPFLNAMGTVQELGRWK